MAKGEIFMAVKVDRFFIDTRIHQCSNEKCPHHKSDELNCKFKNITLDEEGKCEQYDAGS